MRGRPSVAKRQKERERAERKQEKAAKRMERRGRPRPESEGGEDPDIAGIVPGPQPESET
jgi:hypothetical protein